MDDSDEEMQLINDVARLDSQLKPAGCPCDENLYVHLFRDLNVKPLAKRLKLWRFRKEAGGRGGAGAGGGARPTAAMGAAAGMPGGGGDACPCAEGAVDPRSAAAAAWRAGG